MSKRETMLRSLNQYPFFIRFNTASIIISKIEAMNNLTCDTIVSSQKPFGMRTYVTPEENGDLVLRYSGGLGPISSAMVTSNTEWIKKWKVISSYLTHDHAGEFDRDGKRRIISTLEILPPKTVCTETYIVLYTADNESEAKAYVSYVKTHFFRFLLAQLATTQHLSKGSFSLIPLQDFTATSDINWSQTVEKIDAQLYAKYGLTQEEIDYIESMIKTME